MESGLFEPINSTHTKFENSSTRLYRLKTSSGDKENDAAAPKDGKCKSKELKKPTYLNKKMRKMLENLREKPDSIENADKHNTSKLNCRFISKNPRLSADFISRHAENNS